MELIMYYVCIENNDVTSILSYEPNVPEGVTVFTISDAEYQQIMEQTHTFDVSTNTVIPVSVEVISKKEQELANALNREFLNSSDWKILRHMRQKALGEPTSLTEEEYLDLERQRQAAAAKIVN